MSTESPPNVPPSADRAESAPKGKGGAPRGNSNRTRTGLRAKRDASGEVWGKAKCPKCGTSLAGLVGNIMRGAWRKVWTDHRKAIRRTATEILRARGVERDPEAKMAAQGLVRMTALAERLDRETLQTLKTNAGLREEVNAAISATRAAGGELLKILDRVRELAPPPLKQDTTYTVHFAEENGGGEFRSSMGAQADPQKHETDSEGDCTPSDSAAPGAAGEPEHVFVDDVESAVLREQERCRELGVPSSKVFHPKSNAALFDDDIDPDVASTPQSNVVTMPWGTQIGPDSGSNQPGPAPAPATVSQASDGGRTLDDLYHQAGGKRRFREVDE